MGRAFVFGVLVLAAGCVTPGRLSVSLGAEQLEQELSRSFPVKREASVLFLELAEPKVLLERGSDRLGLKLRASVGVTLLRLEGALTVRGRLRYQTEDSTFFLDEPEVVAFEVPGLPEATAPELFALVSQVTRTVLPTVPVHRLKDGPKKLLLRAVRVEDGRVVAELGL